MTPDWDILVSQNQQTSIIYFTGERVQLFSKVTWVKVYLLCFSFTNNRHCPKIETSSLCVEDFMTDIQLNLNTYTNQGDYSFLMLNNQFTYMVNIFLAFQVSTLLLAGGMFSGCQYILHPSITPSMHASGPCNTQPLIPQDVHYMTFWKSKIFHFEFFNTSESFNL